MNRKEIARRLVVEKAILDVLGEANSWTRAEAKEMYEPGDADAVTDYGRVRRDKPSQSWQVIDQNAFAHWVDEYAPDAIVVLRQINPAWVSRVLKTGRVRIERIDPDTGEVTEMDVTPDGVGQVTSQKGVTVTTTDVAEDAARKLLTNVLGAIGTGDES